MVVMFGSDPEIFISDKMRPEYLVPPAFFRLLHGHPYVYNDSDTEMRHPVFRKKDGITLHEDGAALELSIPASNKPENLFDSIKSGMAMAEEEFSKYFEFGGIVAFPAMKYDVELYNSFGEEMIWCNRAGCDADRDVYNGNQNQPMDMTEHPWRYAGGHMHMSTNDSNIVALLSRDDGMNEYAFDLIRLFSTTIGLCNIAFSKYPMLEGIRQYSFGKPGKWRYQTYPKGFVGLEYRTPSNSWVTNKDLAMELFTLMQICFAISLDEKKKKQVLKYSADAVKTILSANQTEAVKLFKEVEKTL